MSKGGNKGIRPLIDLSAVMDNIPTIMGLNLKRTRSGWQGGYYLNRERHPYRRDKMKVWIWNYNVWVKEEGGVAMSLQTWLITHGGAADYKEAYRIMRGNAIPIFQEFHSVGEEGSYVPESVYEEYRKWGLETCNLYNFMCRLFGEMKVREAWERYNVTTNERGDTIFWYRDTEGRLLHDKIMRYNMIGKRDKTYISRRFKVGEGYTGRAYWGSHLVEDGKKIVLLESEKSVLLCALYYGLDNDMIFLATGGKGNIRDVDENTLLVPDIDAISEWSNIKNANIWEWWNEFDCEIGEHDDIGDAIVRTVMKTPRKIL